MPKFLHLSLLFPGLKLFLLIKLFPQHVLQLLIIFSLTHNPTPLLGSNIPLELMLLLIPPELNPIRDQFQLLLKIPPFLPELRQFNRLQLFRKKELAVDGRLTHMKTIACVIHQ